MANSPVLSDSAGSMISVLDACLLDGFDSRTINSINVAGGVASVTISAGHAYDVHAVIRVAGATGAMSALNDDWRITSAGPSTLTFACPGVADGSAAGAMTAKRSPAGWGKPFSATNKAVYQSQNLAATRLFLRVDDTASQLAPVRGYESMTSVDAGANLFPTIAQLNTDSLTWARSSATGGARREWTLVADDCTFYLLPEYSASYPGIPHLYGFGDLVPVKASDAYHAFILGQASSTIQGPTAAVGSQMLTGSNGLGCYLARDVSQSVGARSFGRAASMISSYFGYSVPDVTTSPDGKAHLHMPVLALDGTSASSSPIRGVLPGLMQPLHTNPAAHRVVVAGEDGLAGRAILFNYVVALNTSAAGRIAFDITGPWR